MQLQLNQEAQGAEKNPRPQSRVQSSILDESCLSWDPIDKRLIKASLTSTHAQQSPQFLVDP